MPTVSEMKALAMAEIESRKDEIIANAHEVLRNPETGFTEYKTTKIVQDKLRGLGITVQKDLAITGVKGIVEGGSGSGPAGAVIGVLDS